jgi:hypothetical protein
MNYSLIPNVLGKHRPNEQWSLNGDTYEGLVWLDSTPKPTIEEIDEWIESYKFVPQTITARQARLVLNRHNLRQTVETAIANADQDTKDEWEFATEIRRDWASLVQIATAIGLTNEQLDDMFIEGATL